MNRTPADRPGALSGGATKRPYLAPRLTVYGDVTSLTRGNNGVTWDGNCNNQSQFGPPSENCPDPPG